MKSCWRWSWGELRDEGFDLALTGFDGHELDALLNDPTFAPGSVDDQGRLDERTPITCPECGHSFAPP
jgi:ParB family chromosome partitioning protein